MKKETTNTIFVIKIRELRKEKGVTIEELADKSGVSLMLLKQLEQNILPEEMMADDAIRLAKVFGCKIDELFE